MINKIIKFKRDWLYKESVLDTYEELKIKIPDKEYMNYYHNILLRNNAKIKNEGDQDER